MGESEFAADLRPRVLLAALTGWLQPLRVPALHRALAPWQVPRLRAPAQDRLRRALGHRLRAPVQDLALVQALVQESSLLEPGGVPLVRVFLALLPATGLRPAGQQDVRAELQVLVRAPVRAPVFELWQARR